MAPLIGFPDAVEVVIGYLRPALAAHGQPVPVGTRVPSPRPGRFVRVERIGGAQMDRVTDRPRIDVHCWGEDEGAAYDLARLARALLADIAGWRGAVAYASAEVGGPNLLPDPESDQPRYAFAVEIALRGQRLTT